MKIKLIAFAFLSFILFSCSKEDTTSSQTPTGPTPNPDGKVHYVDISPIISSNCTGCHGNTPTNGAPMSLTSLTAVKEAIQTRGLISKISLPQGDANLMPKNGTRLSQAAIDKIAKWETDGFIN